MIAEQLARDGVRQTLLVRDAARAPDLPGAEVVVADFTDGDSIRAALRPGDRVFMVSVHEAVDAAHRGAPVVRRRRDRRRRRPPRLPLDREALPDVGLPPRPLALRDGADDPRERPAVRVPADEPLPRRPGALVRPGRRLPGPGRRRPRGADLARGHRRGLRRRPRGTRLRERGARPHGRGVAFAGRAGRASATSSLGCTCATSRERARPGSSRGSRPASRPGTRTSASGRTRRCATESST